ncbi:MAG: aminotransferase class V-fold PLP-dependent enzyme, partial [Candidatus Methanoplasma sp.]|nr:aminotransferase class V-fold PLP-dependent enzyme [Candidatus Methanoplasma sp.]
VSVQHASNITGCVLPIKEITEIAHDNGSLVLVDGAQAAPHMKVNLNDLDVDFYCISIHKMLGPSGMGVMYGKKDALETLRPLCLGGGTVGLTTYDHVDLAPIPDRFEAGLQNYSGIAGTKAALEYLEKIGMDQIRSQDDRLMRMMFEKTGDIKGLRMVGPEDPAKRVGVFSFNIDGWGSHDIAMTVDKIDGIMIRSGMHCAHPFYMSREIDGSARASVYLYNNEQDIDRFADALKKFETFRVH